ncbi:hypothetical protein RJ640_013877 [Escallonia rubra]|uniref:Pentatricopeptide repeat-containing protein n=1 Tax=Escallonia rubra TaxID=112253 RepID=A0AA88U6P1_9ASTE|nr:hypothetical protein RJ640_013877 [Escallonia rubra]
MKQLREAHAQAITCGLGKNNFTLSRLLALCSDPVRGSLPHGLKIFQHIENPTICICNTMIKTCLLKGELTEIIQIYTQMLENGMHPDNYTLPYVLKSCANSQSFYLGSSVHGHCLKLGFSFDIFVGNTLVYMYAGFDKMEDARQVFDEIPCHCVVSWTVLISGYARKGDAYTARLVFDEAPAKDRGIWGSMISGYVQNNCFKEGLHMFRDMQLMGFLPDEAIFVSVLCACAHLGALDIGIWIHRYVERIRLPLSVRLGTALIDMYCKCGKLDIAENVFDEMPRKDTICWNAMISGVAMHGYGERALMLFLDMERDGVQPDDVTFIAILTACSYSGMAYEGLRLLNSMYNTYNIEPKTEHYGCIIDLLSRAGQFEEAKTIVQKMANSSGASEEAIAWRALLSACNDHGQAQLAEVAVERLVQLERHSGAYILLSNLYSAAGKHDCARRIRKKMKSQGIHKTPGCSSVEINGVIHEFVAGEKMNPRIEDMHTLLAIISIQSGGDICPSFSRVNVC